MELDLDQARRRAKELLRAARAGDPDALARMRSDRAPRLADAQRAVATDLGFPSWPALVRHTEAAGGDRAERRARLVSAALNGQEHVAERLLSHDPELARAGFDVALVLGDDRAVAAALDRDAGLVARDLPGPRRKPLSCACHSVFLRPTSPRAPGLRRVVALLLDRGADVNEVHHNEYGAMSVLCGAAGVAHDPETTQLLLDRGAKPDDGESVYHAVEADDAACLELLLARGATVRETNALANAIGDPVKVRVLLEQGDLRPSDPELRDALLHARDPAVAELLIEHGAALDARDRHGLTPYARAARFKSEAMMELLAAAGASTDLDPSADAAADEVAVLLEEAADRTGVVRETAQEYVPGRPVRVSVRRRGIRYDIDDLGGAVAVAGRPPGWLEAAEQVVAELGWNVNRDGVVSVQAVEGRDIDALVRRTAEASAAVLEALFALEE